MHKGQEASQRPVFRRNEFKEICPVAMKRGKGVRNDPRQASKDQMPFWGSVNFILSSGGATEGCSLICALELLPWGTVRMGLDLEGRSRRLLAAS